MRFLLLAFPAAFVLCLCVPAGSRGGAPRSYCISCRGGDDANPGTREAPWRSLDKLHASWELIGPGDSVLFRRGDLFAPGRVGERIGLITIPNRKAGTAAMPIVVGAYGNGERPVISGENCTEYHQALRTGSLAHIEIRELEFRGYVVFRAGDDTTAGIRNLRLHRLKLQGGIDTLSTTKIQFSNPYAPSRVPLPNRAAPIDKVEISFCEFFDTEGEDALNIGSAGDSLWIHHNSWVNVSEEALDVAGGTGHLIEYNFVSGCSVNGFKFHSQFSRQHGITVRGNVITHAGSSAMALVLQNISGSKVYNNTVVSPYSCFFGNRDRLPPEAYYCDFTGNEVFNNIFIGVVQVGGEWIGAGPGAGAWYSAPVHNLLKNNVFSHNLYWHFRSDSTVFRFWEGHPYPDPVAELNRSRTVKSGDPGKFNAEWPQPPALYERMTDPLLIAPFRKEDDTPVNYIPAAASPALFSGKSVPEYPRDFRGNPIPAGGPVSIGAFQEP